MSTDYTALVADMWAAFGAEPFTWSIGSFSRTREFDAGSLGWPRRYIHTATVAAHPSTRQALIRAGSGEEVAASLGNVYRLTKRACEEHRFDNRTLTPSWLAWRAVHEAEQTAHKERNT
jgi:hypothetical protein